MTATRLPARRRGLLESRASDTPTTMAWRGFLFLSCAFVVIGCGRATTNAANANLNPNASPRSTAHAPSPGHSHEMAHADDLDAKLVEVARIHGAPGPWAVAGYRMGEYALRTFGLHKGSFDLEVIHHTPREVQYSCIADGAAAATGASPGKLNLTLVDAPAPDTHTVYRQKSTGRSVTLGIAKSFSERFKDVPREQAKTAGREVLQLRDEEIFDVH